MYELKNAADENTTVNSAFKQVETHIKQSFQVFHFSTALLLYLMDWKPKQVQFLPSFSRFMSWKSADGKAEASHLVNQLGNVDSRNAETKKP